MDNTAQVSGRLCTDFYLGAKVNGCRRSRCIAGLDVGAVEISGIPLASSAGIFFLQNSPTRLKRILEDHYRRQMPFIMEGEGSMLFSSGAAKSVYDGLADSIRAGVRHHPDALRLHVSAHLCSEITIDATIENSSEEPSAPVRPLINVSERGLSKYYLKDIYDIGRLKALQAELGYRSSPPVSLR